MASIQRAEFELGGLFKFHCVSLCGRLYPLPRRTTFGFRNALHLLEARGRDIVDAMRMLQQTEKALEKAAVAISHEIGHAAQQTSVQALPALMRQDVKASAN